MSNIVIKVEDLYKEYVLGTIGYGTLKDDLASWWARIRGKEDPNSIIGQQSRLDKKHKHFLALNGLSFEIKEGEAVGIIGKNGAGKSTLLKILSRITTPSRGCVKIKGKISSLLEVGTGFHPELTGRENIYLNGAILGMKKKEIDKKFDEIVAFSGIEEFIDTPVKRYSSGMYVRLAFSVAAHLDSDILILDEVLAVGDAEFQKKCLGKMDDVTKNQGRTILFVSHNMQAVKNLCSRGIFLKDGKVEFDGDVNEVIEAYFFIDQQKNTEENKKNELLFNIDNNKEISIIGVKVFSDNNNTSNEFNIGEIIKIEVKFQVNVDLDFSNFSIEIYKDGICLFKSWDIDNDLSLAKKSKGQYSYTVELPGYLQTGMYSITIDCGIPNVCAIDIRKECFTFRVVNKKIDETNKSFSRGGLIVSNLDWKLKYIK